MWRAGVLCTLVCSRPPCWGRCELVEASSSADCNRLGFCTCPNHPCPDYRQFAITGLPLIGRVRTNSGGKRQAYYQSQVSTGTRRVYLPLLVVGLLFFHRYVSLPPYYIRTYGGWGGGGSKPMHTDAYKGGGGGLITDQNTHFVRR